jgi:hypothetical protein
MAQIKSPLTHVEKDRSREPLEEAGEMSDSDFDPNAAIGARASSLFYCQAEKMSSELAGRPSL